jgi:hypothetical protein
MAAPNIVTPLEGIILEHMSTGGGATRGETPDLGLLDQTMAMRNAVLPAGGIVLEQSLDSGGSQGEWCVPSHVCIENSIEGACCVACAGRRNRLTSWWCRWQA